METITQTQDHTYVRVLFRGGDDLREMHCFMSAMELLDHIVTAQKNGDHEALEGLCKAIVEGQADRLLRH